MSASEPSFAGDVFNARDLSTRDVARHFVPPAAFSRLISDAHCVLEGPRGSGKTTLLRMLTPEAYTIWRRMEPGPSLSFIGVFVPADVRWAKQLCARLSRVDDIAARDALQESAFSSALNLAIVDTVERCASLYDENAPDHPSLCFQLSRKDQSRIVEALSDLWRLDVRVPSFNGIRLEIRKRQRDIGALALDIALGRSVSDIFSENNYLATGWLDSAIGTIESINEILERPEQRWAVLLDELEIVPPTLLASIVTALRSTSPLLRFKLALSPSGSDLIGTPDPSAPTASNDYRPVKLWYENRDEARSFAERLFSRAARRLGILQEGQSLAEALAGSVIWDDEPGQDDVHAIEFSEGQSKSSNLDREKTFVALYSRDESFRIFLDEKGVKPDSLPTSDKTPAGALIRKIAPLVLHREREVERFDSKIGKTQRKGGRKSLHIYGGYPALLDLTEANPRWVLTLVEALNAESNETGRAVGAQSVQTQAIRAFVEQFASKLMVYPIGESTSSLHASPLQFVDRLAGAITQTLFDGPFVSDPPLSFTIDQEAMSQYGSYIRTCIDLGALVIIRRGPSAPLSTMNINCNALVGSRVRISYRLAPHYRIPLRSTKEQPVSRALRLGGVALMSATLTSDGFENRPTGSKTTTGPEQFKLL